ncbi:putative zinc-binding protein [Methanopyrus sp. SNP6]|uniref:putative zinc-binding protein n=1 Tax=Methanopyrus sp. SNP6 TaxID=1937005 RepID=UPI00143B3FFE|nr:putative zinc-binding protein [Methanopyrus sp. SNP6]
MSRRALMPCIGMSPNGFVSRVAVAELSEEEGVPSICPPATAAGKKKFLDLLKRVEVLVIAGCDHNCPEKILKEKVGKSPSETVFVSEVSEKIGVNADSMYELTESNRRLAEEVKKKVKELL